jgi:hypothetical protein
MTGQGSGGHSRLSRAHCQRPPTGVVTWVRGPPARTVWSHSMTGQGSGGHSRLSRAHCQCPPDRRGHLGARASGPHRLATFDGGHSRLSRARCQCPPTGVVAWVRGPPARTVWPHSRTDQGSGGHSRLSRARCQCLPTSVVTWVRGPTAHIMRGAETHRFVHQPTFLFLPPSPASGGEPVLAMRQQV